MAKKLFGLSVFLWILIALVVLFFVYGVGRREGFYAGDNSGAACSTRTNYKACVNNGCKWKGNDITKDDGKTVQSKDFGTCS